MGLLLGEVTRGEHAVFPHNKRMKGKRFDWLLKFGFNWLYFYHCQHSRQPVWAEGCWLVKVHILHFFTFSEQFSTNSPQGISRTVWSRKQETGSGAGTAKGASLGHCFCLGFLNIFFPDASQLCLRKQFYFVYLLVVWIICAEERSAISKHFLIAEDCHFQ